MLAAISAGAVYWLPYLAVPVAILAAVIGGATRK